MVAPVVPVAPPLPDPPKGTPAWLLKLASLALLLMGPAIAWIDPTGKIDSTAWQAIIIIVFLAAALTLFSIHVVLGAVHEYGWSKTAFESIETQEKTEFDTVWPGFKAQLDAAGPVLSQLPGYGDMEARLHAVEAKADAVPTIDKDALKAALAETPLADLFSAAKPAAPAAPEPVADPAVVGQVS